MAFQPCPGIAQVELVSGVNQEITENVFHVLNSAPWDRAACLALGSLMGTSWATNMLPHLSTAVTLLRFIVTDLTTALGVRVTVNASPGTIGGDPGIVKPNNVAYAIKADTGLRGRSQRGRVFLCGLTDNSVVADNIVGAFQTPALAALNQLVADVNAVTGHQLCVLSRRTGGALRANGVGTPILNWVATDGFVDSQRRRLPGHNRHH